jgi:tripartite-type tricarboxylate transporter receptor subunit TctC
MSALLAGIASIALLSPASAQAETWPERPVRLVVGFPAGGQSDIMARVIAESLSGQLGKPVIVDNKSGASGIIAAEHVARSKPDGYTMLLTSESLQSRAAAVYKKLPYDPLGDFAPVAKFAKQRTLLVVNSASPHNTVRDLITHAKANPGKLNYAATYSTSSQFGGALFSLLNKVDLVAVGYPGGAKPITDLLGGVVDVGFFVESTVAEHIKAGKMKVLASASVDRSTIFPNAPTVAEAGGAAMDVSPWFGLAYPANTPQAIVEKTAQAVHNSLKTPELRKRFETIGAFAIEGSTPANFSADLQKETVYWKNFVKQSNFPLID